MGFVGVSFGGTADIGAKVAVGINDAAGTPFPWLSGFADLPREANFFESRVIDYRKGPGLEW